MNIGAEGEEDNNNKKKEKEAEAWRGRICSLNGGQKRAVEDDGNFRGGREILPSFSEGYGYRGLLRVIYLYGLRAEGKYTYSLGGEGVKGRS